jgi:hypothetical protein
MSIKVESNSRHHGTREASVNAFREIKETAKTECSISIKGSHG